MSEAYSTADTNTFYTMYIRIMYLVGVLLLMIFLTNCFWIQDTNSDRCDNSYDHRWVYEFWIGFPQRYYNQYPNEFLGLGTAASAESLDAVDIAKIRASTELAKQIRLHVYAVTEHFFLCSTTVFDNDEINYIYQNIEHFTSIVLPPKFGPLSEGHTSICYLNLGSRKAVDGLYECAVLSHININDYSNDFLFRSLETPTGKLGHVMSEWKKTIPTLLEARFDSLSSIELPR